MHKKVEEILEIDDDALFADGFDAAIIGSIGIIPLRVVYDAERCIELLIENLSCDFDDAREYFEFNCEGAYIGERTPIFVYLLDTT